MPSATKKAPAKKAAAPKKAAPAKAAAKKAPAKAAAKPADNGAAAEARRAERTKENERLTKEVVRLRSMGENWEHIASELSISQGKAQLLLMKSESSGEKPTAAKIKKDRDGGASWGKIMAKYDISKTEAQKLYAEAGGDPHASYIGKGGRYFGHEEKVAKAKGTTNGAKAKPSRSESAAKAKAENAKLKPLFPALAKKATLTDSERDEFIAKVDGKVVTWASDASSTGTLKAKVTPGSVKVGKQKDGKRVIQFASDGKSRTVAVADIVKVASS